MDKGGADDREMMAAARKLGLETIFDATTCMDALVILMKPDLGLTLDKAVAFVEAYSSVANVYGLLFFVDLLAGMARDVRGGITFTASRLTGPGKAIGLKTQTAAEWEREHSGHGATEVLEVGSPGPGAWKRMRCRKCGAEAVLADMLKPKPPGRDHGLVRSGTADDD